jgi:L-Ala-D/L-Glu epimerase
MKITVSRFTVNKRHALTISRGTSAGSDNLLVEVSHAGIVGMGEMAPTSGGETAETAETAEADLSRWIERLTDYMPSEMQRIEAILDEYPGGRAARAALDCALYDWLGLRHQIPVWQMFGLDRERIPETSITLGINPPEVVRERVPEILDRTQARSLKVKLGSPEGVEADRAMFAAAQEAAELGAFVVRWRVDANGGWNVKTAQGMLKWLAERGVEFVEQPLPRGQEADLPALYKGRALPIFVDESVHLAADIPPLAAHVDGVNLKLMKCGGLREAMRIFHVCQAHGLKVMMGCMSESSLAITAAAHLSPLADALDLDSHLNLLDDPFFGAEWRDGRILPTAWPGLGVRRRHTAGMSNE